MFVDFFSVCFDAIYNNMAKNIYFSGGAVKVPMVLMTSTGGGYSDGGQHSGCVYGTFAHLPGMKVVVPSNAHGAKGLMTAAIRDNSPVIHMYHKGLQGMRWLGNEKGSIVHTREDDYTVPIGKAALTREGKDVSIVTLGIGVHHALRAAETLAEGGVEAEVIDLRSLVLRLLDEVAGGRRTSGTLLCMTSPSLVVPRRTCALPDFRNAALRGWSVQTRRSGGGTPPRGPAS